MKVRYMPENIKFMFRCRVTHTHLNKVGLPSYAHGAPEVLLFPLRHKRNRDVNIDSAAALGPLGC